MALEGLEAPEEEMPGEGFCGSWLPGPGLLTLKGTHRSLLAGLWHHLVSILGIAGFLIPDLAFKDLEGSLGQWRENEEKKGALGPGL